MNELIARCSGTFKPKSAEDFIGRNVHQRQQGCQTGAHLVAKHLEKMVRMAKASDNAPLRLLLAGESGIGKSELMKYLMVLANCTEWSTTHLNGTQCKIEVVEDIARNLQLTNLFGDYRLIWIDEADEIPRTAQVRFLTLLDKLPPSVIVACTSNCRLKNFEDRFQSRFQVFELCPPPADEISNFIVRLAPQITVQDACNIAQFCCGNVRQALSDAHGILQDAA